MQSRQISGEAVGASFDDSALVSRITALENSEESFDDSALDSRITTLESETVKITGNAFINGTKSFNGVVVSYNGVLFMAGTNLATMLEGANGGLAVSQDLFLNNNTSVGVSSQIATLQSRATTLESQATAVEARATTLESQTTALDTRVTTLEARATEMESLVTVAKSNASLNLITLATLPQYSLEYSDTSIPATRNPLTATILLATKQVTVTGFVVKLSNGSATGLPSGTGNLGEVIFTLPIGFRIDTEQTFDVDAYTSATPGANDSPDRTAKVKIKTDGSVFFDGQATYQYFNPGNTTNAHGIHALEFDLTFDR